MMNYAYPGASNNRLHTKLNIHVGPLVLLVDLARPIVGCIGRVGHEITAKVEFSPPPLPMWKISKLSVRKSTHNYHN